MFYAAKKTTKYSMFYVKQVRDKNHGSFLNDNNALKGKLNQNVTDTVKL